MGCSGSVQTSPPDGGNQPTRKNENGMTQGGSKEHAASSSSLRRSGEVVGGTAQRPPPQNQQQQQQQHKQQNPTDRRLTPPNGLNSSGGRNGRPTRIDDQRRKPPGVISRVPSSARSVASNVSVGSSASKGPPRKRLGPPRLHYSDVSPFCRAVLVFLGELNLSVELVLLDLESGEQNRSPFAEMNPHNRLPVLEMGEVVLTESASILKFLPIHFRIPDAFPLDMEVRTRVNEVIDFCNNKLATELLYHFIYPQLGGKGVFEHDSDVIARGHERASVLCQYLNDVIIGEQPYVAGTSVTIADYFAWAVLTTGDLIGLTYDAFPNLNRWLKTIDSLPSACNLRDAFVSQGEIYTMAAAPQITTLPASNPLSARLVPPQSTPCRVYLDPSQWPSRAVLFFLLHNNYPVEIVYVSEKDGDTRDAPLCELSPLGELPVLEDGPWACGECGAILKYLAVKHSSIMYPHFPITQAEANSVIDWALTQLYVAYLSHLVEPQYLSNGAGFGPATDSVVEDGRSESGRQLAILENTIIGDVNNFVCGDTMTVADCVVWAIVTEGEIIGQSMEPYPNISRWLGLIRSLPCHDDVNEAHREVVKQYADGDYVTL